MLRRVTVETEVGPVSLPAPPVRRAGETTRFGPVPAIGEHTEAIRAEFSA
ncbi:MAG: hypothetical protein RML45_11290 [Acetobacteraceae bacterium]|nr:hypothetical protein [Acetobacteraceae bacterium]